MLLLLWWVPSAIMIRRDNSASYDMIARTPTELIFRFANSSECNTITGESYGQPNPSHIHRLRAHEMRPRLIHRHPHLCAMHTSHSTQHLPATPFSSALEPPFLSSPLSSSLLVEETMGIPATATPMVLVCRPSKSPPPATPSRSAQPRYARRKTLL